MFSQFDAIEALKKLEVTHPKNAKIIEKIFRLETAHFKSEQFRHTGSAGMEVGKWFGLPKNLGVYTTKENGTGLYKSFIIWQSPYDFLVYLSDYIDRHNGNYARWYSTNTIKQLYYRTILKGIKNRIVLLYFLCFSSLIFGQKNDTIEYFDNCYNVFKENRVIESNFIVSDSCLNYVSTGRTPILKSNYKFCLINKKINSFDFGHLIPASAFFCAYTYQRQLNRKDNVTYQNSFLNRTIIRDLEFLIKKITTNKTIIKITIKYEGLGLIPSMYIYKISTEKEIFYFYFKNKKPFFQNLGSYQTTEKYYNYLIKIN